MRAKPGTVYLVGAGPGDPGLITARGLELLRSCNVVLYDRLVSPLLLDEAPEGAERIFVGKKPGETHSRQLVSDALLVSKARENKSVVRLKGGDPFVFGRGGEEAGLLRDASIPFELVPGVSSAIAAPAYAGIPLTHRGVAASFVVLTARDEGGSGADVATIATGAETVVLLMGVAALDDVMRGLIASGRDPEEPAATIEWGTTGKQRVVVGTVATIAALVSDAGLGPPATTVIGHVVQQREDLAWFEHRPLFGRSVAVTRPRSQSKELTARLSELGADVVQLPLIDIADPSSWDAADASVKELNAGGYSWAVFSSSNAVERFLSRVREQGSDARAFGTARIAAVGARTAHSLSQHGLSADVVPSRFDSNEMASAMGRGEGKVLFPRVEAGPHEPIAALEALGWTVEEVPVYSNVPGTPVPEVIDRVRAGEVDIITLTSASTARNLKSIVGEVSSRIVCIGPATAQEAATQGFEVQSVADRYDNEGLIDAVLTIARTIDT